MAEASCLLQATGPKIHEDLMIKLTHHPRNGTNNNIVQVFQIGKSVSVTSRRLSLYFKRVSINNLALDIPAVRVPDSVADCAASKVEEVVEKVEPVEERRVVK